MHGTDTASTNLNRFLAAGVALVALAAVALQDIVALEAPGRPAGTPVWWWLAGYFTVLTNLAVALTLAGVALGWRCPARFSAGLILAIGMVGIVYHAVLAGLWQPEGLAWWADQGLHTMVPVLAFAWWLTFADKRVTLHDLPFWLVWPATYLVYALLRGKLTGFWPYPFLDAGTLGWPAVTINVAVMVAGFAILGVVLVAIARLARRSVR